MRNGIFVKSNTEFFKQNVFLPTEGKEKSEMLPTRQPTVTSRIRCTLNSKHHLHGKLNEKHIFN